MASAMLYVGCAGGGIACGSVAASETFVIGAVAEEEEAAARAGREPRRGREAGRGRGAGAQGVGAARGTVVAKLIARRHTSTETRARLTSARFQHSRGVCYG